jgi:hypothetical protein
VAVSTLHPQGGTQALLVNGAGLAHAPDYPSVLIGADARRVFDIDPVARGAPIVGFQVGVRLDGPSTDTGGGVNDDLISANLAAFDGDGGFLTEMLLSSNGNVYSSAWDNPYQFATPVALREYQTLGMRLNYLTRSTDYFVNGQHVGTLPFGDQITSNRFRGPALMVFAFDDPVIDPALYTASFDNFSLEVAVPEPGRVGVLGVGFVVAGLARRRRRNG